MPTPIDWIPWDDRAKASVRKGPHAFNARILNWPYCTRCGLVKLKNEVSAKAAKQQCNWIE